MTHHRSQKPTKSNRSAMPATVALLSGLSWVALAAPSGTGTEAIRPIDPVEAKTVSYRKQIQPLLTSRCGACHTGNAPSAGLNTSTLTALEHGGKQGPALVAGQPDASLLVQYVRGVKTPRMPMSGSPLTADEVHLLREWISAGARDDGRKAGKAAVTPKPYGWDLPIEDESSLTLAEIRAKHLARMPAPPHAPHIAIPAYNAVDRFIGAKWVSHKFPIPPICDDATFVRRVYLDVVGVIPTADQVRAFIADKASDKRHRLVDTLLARDDDYALAWLPWWEDALASNGNHQGGADSHPNLQPWLLANLRENRPYDEMAAELLDPTTVSPTAPLARGWVLNNDHVATTQSAAATAQVFLGTAVKCASCHNHFLNPEWTQRKFVGYASYFAPKDLEVIRCEVHEGDFVPATFLFDQPSARGAAQHIPSDLDHRLQQVSRLIVDPENPRFARSIVNRLWKRYLGLGLVEPADDFRAEGNTPSHPELLDWMADDFMRHGYDLKHTIRLILDSRTYQLQYDPHVADTYSASSPDRPRYFRSPTLRRLTEEQLLDSINVAIGSTDATRACLDDDSTALTRALGRSASRNEVSTGRSDDVAVVQSLELLNGEEFSTRVTAGPLAQSLSQERDPAKTVAGAYWATYGRSPLQVEVGAGKRFLNAGGPADVKSAPPETVWWEDGPPPGAMLTGPWQLTKDTVFSGIQAHSAPPMAGAQQHYFLGASDPLRLGPGDTLFTDVYLDPQNPPREVMLQWYDGTWEHRAFWGDDLVNFGTTGTASRRRLGDLPLTGRWVRLEIPVGAVDLSGHLISGMSFDQFDGHVFFDHSGVTHAAPPRPAVADMLWALVSAPEFQYIH